MDKPFPFVNIVQKNGIAWSIPQGSSRIKFVPVATMKRVTKVLDSWIEMLNAFRAIWMLQEPRNDLKIKEFDVLYHKLGFDLFFLKRLIHQISQIVWTLNSFEKHLQTIIQLQYKISIKIRILPCSICDIHQIKIDEYADEADEPLGKDKRE